MYRQNNRKPTVVLSPKWAEQLAKEDVTYHIPELENFNNIISAYNDRKQSKTILFILFDDMNEAIEQTATFHKVISADPLNSYKAWSEKSNRVKWTGKDPCPDIEFVCFKPNETFGIFRLIAFRKCEISTKKFQQIARKCKNDQKQLDKRLSEIVFDKFVKPNSEKVFTHMLCYANISLGNKVIKTFLHEGEFKKKTLKIIK